MILFEDFMPFRSEQVTLSRVMFLHGYHSRPLSWENASFPLTVDAFFPYDVHKHWDLVLSLQNLQALQLDCSQFERTAL